MMINGKIVTTSEKLGDTTQCLAGVAQGECVVWDPSLLPPGEHTIKASVTNKGRSISISRSFTVAAAAAIESPAEIISEQPEEEYTPPNIVQSIEEPVAAEPAVQEVVKAPEEEKPEELPIVIVETTASDSQPITGKVILSPPNPANIATNATLVYTVDEEVVKATTGAQPQVEIDSVLYDDGPHSIGLTITDPTGEEDGTIITTTVDNSASQIANRLGDVTRNAVIGKVHRLGLSGRATTSRMKTVRPRKKMARPQQQRSIRFGGLGGSVREALQFAASQRGANQSFEPTEELAIPVEQRATIATLKECSCRWPVGDPTHEDFYFCGGDKVAGLPYCEFHARKAYQPAQQRRRDRHVQKQTATG